MVKIFQKLTRDSNPRTSDFVLWSYGIMPLASDCIFWTPQKAPNWGPLTSWGASALTWLKSSPSNNSQKQPRVKAQQSTRSSLNGIFCNDAKRKSIYRWKFDHWIRLLALTCLTDQMSLLTVGITFLFDRHYCFSCVVFTLLGHYDMNHSR